MSFIAELKRRNVIHMAGLYLVGAWLVTQVAATLLPVFEAPNWLMKTLIAIMAMGFIPTLIGAWFFELSDSGLKHDSELLEEQSITPQKVRHIERIIIALFALALIFFAFDKFLLAPKREAALLSNATKALQEKELQQALVKNKKSIAVLPFTNLSAQGEDAYFSLGLHDEILSQLSKISDLRVISRTSVMGYQQTNKRLPEIARELQVARILEGTVKRFGDRVRINVKLFDADKEKLVWENTSDEELTADNLFESQHKITLHIAENLGLILTGEEQISIRTKPTQNIETYNAFLKGKTLSRYGESTEKQFLEAIVEFDKAITLDPLFAAAYAEKANAHLALYWSGRNRAINLIAARKALDQAIEIDPNSAATLVAMGTFYYRVLSDYPAAIRYLSRASKLAPGNVDAWKYLGAALRRSGHFEKAVSAFKKAYELNPMRSSEAADLAYSLGILGRLKEANSITSKALKISPNSPYLIGVTSHLGILGNKIEQAWRVAQKFEFIDSAAYDFFRSYMLLYLKEPEQIREVIDKLPTPRQHPPFLNYIDLMRIFAMHRLKELDSARPLLTQLQARVETALKSDPEHIENRKIITAIYGLQGDVEKLKVAHDNLVLRPPKDRLWLTEEGFIVIVAHAVAGENNTCLELIGLLMELSGTIQFARIELSPFFDKLRNEKKYLQLKQRYLADIEI